MCAGAQDVGSCTMLKTPGTVAAKTWSSNHSNSPKPNLQPHKQLPTEPNWNTCSRSPHILSQQRSNFHERRIWSVHLRNLYCILFRVPWWQLQRYFTVWRPKDPERIPRACLLAGSPPCNLLLGTCLHNASTARISCDMFTLIHFIHCATPWLKTC